jgi:hypothetical protein
MPNSNTGPLPLKKNDSYIDLLLKSQDHPLKQLDFFGIALIANTFIQYTVQRTSFRRINGNLQSLGRERADYLIKPNTTEC